MNYDQFLEMIPEAALVAVLLIVFFADLCCNSKKVKTLGILSTLLLLLPLAASALAEPTMAFGGLYYTTEMANVMKVILTAGTIIVCIMAQPWLEREGQQTVGEFYELIISTLLGMFMMISSGNFLMFFLGLETASVPMACLVALDKRKKESAEAAAKYILTATFSSGVMLFGISFVYGSVGTLYFDDIAQRIAYMTQFSSHSCPSTSGRPTPIRELPRPSPAI